MRMVIGAIFGIVFPVLCIAQAPSSVGPIGKMGPEDIRAYEPPAMVLVPEWWYEMGDHHGFGPLDELPLHEVYISAFSMDKFEVSNKEYCIFLNSAYRLGQIEVISGVVWMKGDNGKTYCDTTVSASSSGITWSGSFFGVVAGKANHPMVSVTWYGAAAYANWRSFQEGIGPCYDLDTWECNSEAGGYRLPSEAEWEYAARGGENNPYYMYPWGNSIDGSNANYWNSGDPYDNGTTPVGYYDGNQIPSGVDMVNGYGLYDIAGNVWEWCNDRYNETYYQYCVDNDIYYNPKGPESGNSRVLRGGSWGANDHDLRCASRMDEPPQYRHGFWGFRLVQSCPKPMALIPAGEFEMGDHHDSMVNAKPVHAVYIDAFYMDTLEVTNAEYCAYLNSALNQELIEVTDGVVYKKNDTELFCETNSSSSLSQITWNGNAFGITEGKEDHPMVMVTWFGAVSYANWRSLKAGLTPSYDLETWECTYCVEGFRLPSEAEWEMAARGGQYSPYHRFPWGSDLITNIANYAGSVDPYETGDYPWTTPVGFYTGELHEKTNFNWPSSQNLYQTLEGMNDWGLHDMAGNVWEWCNDWYDQEYYQYCVDNTVYYNPKGPSNGTERALRSGAWASSSSTHHLRSAYRWLNAPDYRYSNIGFRLIHDPYEPPDSVLIPEGEYEMGDHSGIGAPNERPIHATYIDAFLMDVFEVTHEEYCTYLNSAYSQELIEVSGGVVYKKDDIEPYCDTTTSSSNSRITWNGSTFGITTGKEDHPVVMVSWYGAVAYANWRNLQEGLAPCYDLETWESTFNTIGYRLPTEAEWEKASRGGEHNPYNDYPWGNGIDGSQANYLDSNDPYDNDTTPVGYYDGNQTPPGVDMANGYGLYDMSGNVWELCNDWFDEDYYQYCVDNNIYYNPKGPVSSPYGSRAARGGSWGNLVQWLRCAERNGEYPDYRYHSIGFRLVLATYELPPMVQIPEGWYAMGDHHDGDPEALPVHYVEIDTFWMDVFEVTNKEYCRFLNSAYQHGEITVVAGLEGTVYGAINGKRYCLIESNWPCSRIHWDGSHFIVTNGKKNHPMVHVSWHGAVAYANWRSEQAGLVPCYDLETWECSFGVNGYRLPTEAEWEYAARGNEHNPYYRYPWGNEIDGSNSNYNDSGDPWDNDDYPETAPVGYYDGDQVIVGIPVVDDMVNGYVLYDMSGNVWEWCNDWEDDHYYQYCVDNNIFDNPKGPVSGIERICRGGSWNTSPLATACAHRGRQIPNNPEHSGLAFRLVIANP